MTDKEYNIGVLQDLKSALCSNLEHDSIEEEIERALDYAIEAIRQESKTE